MWLGILAKRAVLARRAASMRMHLIAASLLLCLRGATGLHARPATPLSPRRLSRVRSAVPVCAEDGADSDELAKARRRRDEQALQAEWRDGLAQNAKVSLGPDLRLILLALQSLLQLIAFELPAACFL